jgi:DNA-binding NarL/FixJ family response regulator
MVMQEERHTGPPSGPIRILLTGHHALLREAIRSALENEPDIVTVSESQPGRMAVAEAERVRPDVALLEVVLPRADGIRAIREIRARVPECRVLLLCDGEHQNVLIEGLEAGANGYVSQESPLSELVEATRAVYRGESVIPPRMLGRLITNLIERRREQGESMSRVSKLSPREREVLRLLAEGADNIAIGDALVISPQTARTHIQNILTKLGVHSRLEAVAYTRRSGLLEELVGPDSDEEDARRPAYGPVYG